MNVLFLCTGNSCRSIIAEATFNHLAPAGMAAISAGSKPTGEVHPRSIALLKSKGISTDGYYSKSWDALEIVPDIVITVCGNAAGETCPAYLNTNSSGGRIMRAHWGVDDPAKATGSDAEINASFESAYQILRKRIEAFFDLPLKDMQEAEIKDALESIGKAYIIKPNYSPKNPPL